MIASASRRACLAAILALAAAPRDAVSAATATIDGPSYWRARLARWTATAAHAFGRAQHVGGGLPSLLEDLHAAARLDRLYLAHRVVNALPFEPEPLGHDEWRHPLRTWQYGGDCEDLALLKLALLSASGVPPADNRLVVADIDGWGLHAFAAVRADGGWWRLDSLREATAWDGGPLPYPGPRFRRLWLSDGISIHPAEPWSGQRS